MDLRIAMVAPPDLPQVVALMGEAFDSRYGEAWSGAQLIGALAIADTWVQAACDAGSLLGFTLVRRILDEAELMLIAVRPDRRGTGLGRDLLRAAGAMASSRGARTLFLEVREGNAAALALYRGAGFAEIGRRQDYYTGRSGERFDAITLRRVLI